VLFDHFFFVDCKVYIDEVNLLDFFDVSVNSATIRTELVDRFYIVVEVEICNSFDPAA
jgi:Mg-chelatase subunit ChlI